MSARDAILIVDGEFGQSLSVWHKEILHALHRGIRVVGASSMGALRAAELDRFGMEGVGEIYAVLPRRLADRGRRRRAVHAYAPRATDR